jgi:hypothetical protein
MDGQKDVMDEQPDNSDWFDTQLPQTDTSLAMTQRDTFEEALTRFTNDVTTTNDTNTTPEPSLEDLDRERLEYKKFIILIYIRNASVARQILSSRDNNRCTHN